ncbi:MAG: AzlD domain-containing protein [Lachnospiraceae bacterium]|nr:AzlD domain-containing protein [Lachnospiraceae bacterium]
MYGRRVYLSLIIMILTVYAIRVTPFLIFRKEIKNKWVKSFLYYVPYVTLAVMTFPAILTATSSIWSGAIALAAGIIVALIGGDLFTVAICACVAVFLSEFIFI